MENVIQLNNAMPTWQQIAVKCATAWKRRRDSNPGSPGHEAAALPSALSHFIKCVTSVVKFGQFTGRNTQQMSIMNDPYGTLNIRQKSFY